MLLVFFRFSILMTVLLCNSAIFGMISSTPQLNFFSQGTDFVKNEICSFLSLNDKLNLRATCITLATTLTNTTLTNDQLSKIYNQFNYEKKQIASSCAFLHCIKEKKYQEVEWFLKNEIHNPLFNISYGYSIKYYAINPLQLIEADDLRMKELFAAYHYDKKKFIESIKRIQEKYCVPVELNKIFQDWQSASNDKSILGEKIDTTSNVYKNTISEKQYKENLLSRVITTDCSSQLILAACIGDINCFDKAMIEIDYANNSNQYVSFSMLLSIFVAFKNKDLNLIRFILTQPFYVKNLKNNITGLLSYFLLNTPIECSTDLKISKNKFFDDKHIQWIKQLIQEGMFTKIPTMIENNKDNNKQIKEIYEMLTPSIYETLDQESTD